MDGGVESDGSFLLGNCGRILFYFLFLFLASLRGTRYLTSPTGDRTRALGSESAEP